EKAGEDTPIRGNDGILRIKDVERGPPIVSIYYHLHAVANVADGILAQLVVTRVRKAVRGGESIHDPVQPAILADHNVRIRIKSEKWSQGGHPRAEIASHQQPALAI